MAGTAGSLSAAISGADSRVTVLEDRIDAEDHAAFLWMRAHQLHGYGHRRVVIGTEPLSQRWNEEKKRFSGAPDAEAYLHHFVHNHGAMTSLGRLADRLGMRPAGAEAEGAMLTRIATALANGRAWVIELPGRSPKSRFVAKTNSDAFAPLNPRYGTNVDFAYIAKLEGDQWLRGYVPMRKGKVVGRSGMTVASGFDLGQWNLEELQKLGFPKVLMEKIKSFAAPHNFKNKTRAQVVALVTKLGPVPELNKTEADQCDGAVFGKILGDALALWDRGRGPGVPAFTAMPGGWQTVWLSRVYQEGPTATSSFRNLARAGKWREAVVALRTHSQYPERTDQEAGLLEKELPAPVAPPGRKTLP